MANVIKYFEQKTQNYQLDKNGFYILINDEYIEIPNTKYKLENGEYIEDAEGTYILINGAYIAIPEEKYNPFVQYDFGVKDPKYINVSGDGNLQTFINRVNNTKIIEIEINKQTKFDTNNSYTHNDSAIIENMWPVLYEHTAPTFCKKTLKTDNGSCTITFQEALPENYEATVLLIPMDTNPPIG